MGSNATLATTFTTVFIVDVVTDELAVRWQHDVERPNGGLITTLSLSLTPSDAAVKHIIFLQLVFVLFRAFDWYVLFSEKEKSESMSTHVTFQC